MACALSDTTVKVYAAGPRGLEHSSTCGGHRDRLVHVSLPFADAPHLVLTACTDAALRCFDTRLPGSPAQAVALFKDAQRRELASGAASPHGSSLAAGAEDGTVLLWDRRVAGQGGGAGGGSRQALGEYTEVHGEAVTCCAYHPTLPHALLTAGLDGLVCVFDTQAGPGGDEDDALQRVLSVGSSVAKVGWFGSQGSSIWATTCTEDASLWNWADGERLAGPPAQGTRSALEQAWLPVASSVAGCGPVTYCCGCAWDPHGDTLVLLAGTQGGVLAAWPLTAGADGTLAVHPPAAVLAGGHTDVVRAATWLGPSGSTLVTGGEDGRLCVWTTAGPGDVAPSARAAHAPPERTTSNPSSGQRYSPY